MAIADAPAPVESPVHALGEARLTAEIADRASAATDLRTTVYVALYAEFAREAAITVDVAELLTDGYSRPQIASALGLMASHVDAAIGRLQRAAHRLRPEPTA
jgi:hypothetical protein